MKDENTENDDKKTDDKKKGFFSYSYIYILNYDTKHINVLVYINI